MASNSLPDLPRLKAEKEYQDATGAAETPLLKVSDFETLRLLDLSNCGLDEWSQVAFFGDLPSLQELILDNNPLPEVQPPVSDSAFPRLHRFSLSSTKYVVRFFVCLYTGYSTSVLAIITLSMLFASVFI